MAYRYTRPPDHLREWREIKEGTPSTLDRQGIPVWLLAMLVVLVLIFGWMIATTFEPDQPDDSTPMIMEPG